MTALSRLLAKAEPQGPCMFGCGLARHRLWDSIDADLRAGEDVWDTADNYGVSVNEVLTVREAYAEARRRKKALPGRG